MRVILDYTLKITVGELLGRILALSKPHALGLQMKLEKPREMK